MSDRETHCAQDRKKPTHVILPVPHRNEIAICAAILKFLEDFSIDLEYYEHVSKVTVDLFTLIEGICQLLELKFVDGEVIGYLAKTPANYSLVTCCVALIKRFLLEKSQEVCDELENTVKVLDELATKWPLRSFHHEEVTSVYKLVMNKTDEFRSDPIKALLFAKKFLLDFPVYQQNIRVMHATIRLQDEIVIKETRMILSQFKI